MHLTAFVKEDKDKSQISRRKGIIKTRADNEIENKRTTSMKRELIF
jgi:hypothetical protein